MSENRPEMTQEPESKLELDSRSNNQLSAASSSFIDAQPSNVSIPVPSGHRAGHAIAAGTVQQEIEQKNNYGMVFGEASGGSDFRTVIHKIFIGDFSVEFLYLGNLFLESTPIGLVFLRNISPRTNLFVNSYFQIGTILGYF